MKIESTDQDIRNLLSSGYYRIPRFQRPYSWTKENIQEFWDDIVRDRPADYFIGSMVAFKEGLAKGIHGLIERRNIDNKEEFILSTETSYPFLQDYILKWGRPEVPIVPMREEVNLQSAYDQFDSLVGEAIPANDASAMIEEENGQAAGRQKLVDIRDAILDLKVILSNSTMKMTPTSYSRR